MKHILSEYKKVPTKKNKKLLSQDPTILTEALESSDADEFYPLITTKELSNDPSLFLLL